MEEKFQRRELQETTNLFVDMISFYRQGQAIVEITKVYVPYTMHNLTFIVYVY